MPGASKPLGSQNFLASSKPTRLPSASSSEDARPARRVARPIARLGPSPSTLIHIECNSGADILDYAHTFFTAYTEGHFRPHVAQKVTIAAFELLANGLRFGTMSDKVVIELLQGNSWIVVRVTNSTIMARIAMLTEHLDKIHASPEGTYVEEMRKSLSGAGQRGAMLGLARVAHEAGLEIFSSVEGARVVVEAYCPA